MLKLTVALALLPQEDYQTTEKAREVAANLAQTPVLASP